MLYLKRFLYTCFFGSMVAWTIYLLTVDFYTVTVASYIQKPTVSIPFSIELHNWQSLGLINGVTLIVVFASAVLSQIKMNSSLTLPITNR